jgi:hypothetical protein
MGMACGPCMTNNDCQAGTSCVMNPLFKVMLCYQACTSNSQCMMGVSCFPLGCSCFGF